MALVLPSVTTLMGIQPVAVVGSPASVSCSTLDFARSLLKSLCEDRTSRTVAKSPSNGTGVARTVAGMIAENITKALKRILDVKVWEMRMTVY